MTQNKADENLGDMIFANKTLYGSELVFDYLIEKVKDSTLSESDIDTKSVFLLKKLGWTESTEIRQQKTNISEIDDHLRSKTVDKSTKKGHADIYLLDNNKLKVIIDNKNPKQSVDEGIADAISYADCLLEKKYDIRIVLSYNGLDCILRVLDSKTNQWVPLTVNGKQINGFPSKELVDIIYRYRDICNIVVQERNFSINIKNTIQQLKEIYRNIPHIQNDNQNTMDFTIAFISLKSILEKHGSQLGKDWSDLNVSEQKRLKELIKTYVEDIIENLENGYGEIFKIKEDPKGKIKAFDFLGLVNQFPNIVSRGESAYLIKIFQTLDKLPHLHSSKFDPFAEVYQSLMDKHTRKIFGQFFTPRHLIRTLVRLFYENEIETIIDNMTNGKSEKPKLICDPACGTGGFLTESFKYIASKVVDVDVKDLAKKTIHGFDIYPANTARSRINMYLAGDGFSKMDPLDCLKEIDDKTKFDYILTNPPFGKGDYIVDSSILSNKRKEVNFLIKIVTMLKSNGKALVIVPDGVLEAPTLSPLRKWLLEWCIVEKIIGLPKHEFAPYTHEKTFALFLKKRPKRIVDLHEIKTERIWMYIVDTDGYANSDKKFRTGKKDSNGKWLHDELSLWQDNKGTFHVSILEENWKKKTQTETEKYVDEWDVTIEGQKYGYVEINTILEQQYTFFKSLSKTQICKLLKNEDKEITIKKNQDMFEKNNGDSLQLKSEIEKILSSKNIFYDSYENKFFDENTTITKQFLNLDPLTYLRPKKHTTISFEEFTTENNNILKQIGNDLKELQKELACNDDKE